MNKTLAVLGGDRRYLYIIEELALKGCTIYAAGFDHIKFDKKQVIKKAIEEIPFSMLDALILPVLGMDEGGKIESCFPKGTLFLKESHLNELAPNAMIVSGTATDYLIEVCNQFGHKLVLLYELDDVAILNAIPTAEATLQLAIEYTEETIHGSSVFVFGFGRVGKTIAHIFHQVGANVTIAARKEADLARATALGLQAIPLHDANNYIHHYDIFINTVPHLVITKEMIQQMKKSSLIIDLASTPGGTDFSAAKESNIKTIHALGLPGKTAPKTAGLIIADKIEKLFNNH